MLIARADAVRKPLSLRGRITAAIMLTAMVVLSLTCTLFMIEQRAVEVRTARSHLRQLAHILATSAVRPGILLDATEGNRWVAALRTGRADAAAELVTPQGVVLASTGDRTPAQADTIKVSERVVHAGRLVGVLTLWSRSPRLSILAPQYLAMGGALFFSAMGFALFLGRWLSVRVTEPVGRLVQAMDAVGRSGDFSARVALTDDDEIGRLTERFNALLATLEHNDAALRCTLAELVDARDAAQAASVQKSQFLANMSHEIRTPLNGVLVMAQIMAREPLTADQEMRLDVIRRSGEALLRLLNDILDMSKIEAGRFELEDGEFDAAEALTAATQAFQGLAETKGLALNVVLAPDVLGVRRGDAGRLRQILSNLLSNALKFTQSGEVSVTASGLGPDGAEGLRIAVRDTGIGISADQLHMLFRKFSQVDASVTRRFGGTGLGLAISQEVAELMGGRIDVVSEPGKGSTFTAILPLPILPSSGLAASTSVTPDSRSPDFGSPKLGAPAEPKAATDLEASTPLRVLAAEDNATNQLVLTTLMDIFGCDLTLAQDGRQAVAAWETGGFDVILMDIQMPVMDGVTAARAIRAREAATGRSRTPIVALSANALVHQVDEYLAAGMDDHLAKPIELTKLQAALQGLSDAIADRAAA